MINPMVTVVATAELNADGTFAINRGFLSSVRNGPGDYTLMLLNPIDAGFVGPVISVRGASAGVATYSIIGGGTGFQILTFEESAGTLTATDRIFDILVMRQEN